MLLEFQNEFLFLFFFVFFFIDGLLKTLSLEALSLFPKTQSSRGSENFFPFFKSQFLFMHDHDSYIVG